MGTNNIHIITDTINLLIQCKFEIITGIFSALAINSYFYNIKIEKRFNIMTLKKKLEEIKKDNPQSIEEMSEERISHLANILNRIEKSFEKRFDKIDEKQDKQDAKIDGLENRVVLVEKNNAVTRRELALYVTIGVFVILQILDKINIF